MKKIKRLKFKLESNIENKYLCEALSKELDKIGLNIGDDIQITISKDEESTEVKVDYYETLYQPACKFGYIDCIHDPEYKKYYYNDTSTTLCEECEYALYYYDDDKDR